MPLLRPALIPAAAKCLICRLVCSPLDMKESRLVKKSTLLTFDEMDGGKKKTYFPAPDDPKLRLLCTGSAV
jgi:hypothetical protein